MKPIASYIEPSKNLSLKLKRSPAKKLYVKANKLIRIF